MPKPLPYQQVSIFFAFRVGIYDIEPFSKREADHIFLEKVSL